eukprot:1731385-Pleurochrysis_carterae.AAC.2
MIKHVSKSSRVRRDGAGAEAPLGYICCHDSRTPVGSKGVVNQESELAQEGGLTSGHRLKGFRSYSDNAIKHEGYTCSRTHFDIYGTGDIVIHRLSPERPLAEQQSSAKRRYMVTYSGGNSKTYSSPRAHNGIGR